MAEQIGSVVGREEREGGSGEREGVSEGGGEGGNRGRAGKDRTQCKRRGGIKRKSGEWASAHELYLKM